MKKITSTVLLVSFYTPFLALAQAGGTGIPGAAGINERPIQVYAGGIISVVNYILVPVLMAIAFIVFLWGVYKYFILGAADETSRTEGRQFTLWGVIGFVVITSLWGLVYLIMSTFGLSGTRAPAPPKYELPTTAGPAVSNPTPSAYDICVANPNDPSCGAL